MPGGAEGGPFRNSSSLPIPTGSVRRSPPASSAGGRSVRSSRSAASLGGSSRGSGARAALRTALSVTDVNAVVGKLGQEASEKYGSLSKALQSVQTDNRGGVNRSAMRSLCDEYGLATRASDQLFDTLDYAKEGTINIKDFTELVSNNTDAGLNASGTSMQDAALTDRAPMAPQATERTSPVPNGLEQSSRTVAWAESQKLGPKTGGATFPPGADALRPTSPRGGPGKMSGILKRSDEDAGKATTDKGAGFNSNRQTGVQRKPPSDAGSNTGRATLKRSASEPADERGVPVHVLDQIAEDISHFARSKKGSMAEAFAELDVRKARRLDRQDISRALLASGYDQALSDQFFDHIDKDKAGSIDYTTFQKTFGHAYANFEGTQRGNSRRTNGEKKESPEKEKATMRGGTAKPGAPQPPLVDQDVKDIFANMAASTGRNRSTIRGAFNAIQNMGDNNKTATGIDKPTLRKYMAHSGYDAGAADKMFEYLDIDRDGRIGFEEFSDSFGPHIQPDWTAPKDKGDRSLPINAPICIGNTPALEDRALQKVVRDVGNALANKYTNPHDCFRKFDADGTGTVDRAEVREFFARFTFDAKTSDQFFDAHKANAKGEILRSDFAGHFSPYLTQGLDVRQKRSKGSYVEHARKPTQMQDQELQGILNKMGQNMANKYKSFHGGLLKAWRLSDDNKDGALSRQEMRLCFKNYGFDDSMSDKFFDAVDTDKTGTVDYGEFQEIVAPYIYGWVQLGHEDTRLAANEDHYAGKAEQKNRGCLGNDKTMDLSEKTLDAGSLRDSLRGAGFNPNIQTGNQRKPYSDAGSNAGSSTLKRSASEPARPRLKKEELEAIFNEIAMTAAKNSGSNVQRAFTNISKWGPPTKSNCIDSRNFRDYLNLAGYDNWTADQVFNHIDGDGSGQININKFGDIFGPYIYPPWVDKEESTLQRSLPPPPKEVNDKPMKNIIKDVGIAVARKYSDAKAAFRTLDPKHTGCVSKSSCKSFFSQFSYPNEVADEFFKHLSVNADGEADYREFSSHFTPYISPNFDGKIPNREAQAMKTERLLRPEKISDPELAAVIEEVAENAKRRRYRGDIGSVREAWRRIDKDRDGKSDRREMRDFFNSHGFADRYGDKFIDYVDKMREEKGEPTGGEIGYQEFQKYFAPMINGWAQLGYEDTRVDNAEGHYSREESRCRKTGRHLEKVEESDKASANTKRPPPSPAGHKPGSVLESNKTSADRMPGRSAGSAAGQSDAGPADPRQSSHRASSTQSSAELGRVPQSRGQNSQPLNNDEIKKVFRDVATTIGWKAPSINKAFKALNRGRNGGVSKESLTEFMSVYNYDAKVAEQIFDYVDEDRTGLIDYNEFRDLFGPYVMPPFIIKDHVADATKLDRGFVEPAPALKDPQLNKVVKELGTAVSKKYPTGHSCWRTLFPNNSASLSKNDIREFFGRFAFPKEDADSFFAALPRNEDGQIERKDFAGYFKPFIGQTNERQTKRDISSVPLHTLESPKYVQHEDRKTMKELNEALLNVGDAKKARFHTVKDTFRDIDLDKSNKFSREEIHKLFADRNYSKDMADKVFDFYSKGGEDIPYQEFQQAFAPIQYGWSQLGSERGLTKHRAASAPSTTRETANGSAGRALAATKELLTDRAETTKQAQRAAAKTQRLDDKELNRVVANISEKLRSKHGDSARNAFRGLASHHKDYVTRQDVQHLFRKHGHADVADQFFERLDGDGTGGVNLKSFERLFTKHLENPSAMVSGQTSQKAAFGGTESLISVRRGA